MYSRGLISRSVVVVLCDMIFVMGFSSCFQVGVKKFLLSRLMYDSVGVYECFACLQSMYLSAESNMVLPKPWRYLYSML